MRGGGPSRRGPFERRRSRACDPPGLRVRHATNAAWSVCGWVLGLVGFKQPSVGSCLRGKVQGPVLGGPAPARLEAGQNTSRKRPWTVALPLSVCSTVFGRHERPLCSGGRNHAVSPTPNRTPTPVAHRTYVHAMSTMSTKQQTLLDRPTSHQPTNPSSQARLDEWLRVTHSPCAPPLLAQRHV